MFFNCLIYDNYSIKKEFSFILIIIIIFALLLFYLIFFIIKYFDFSNKIESIYQFINLFDKTNVAQNNYILYLDIFKSYLFNKSIPILNKKNTRNIFIETFLNISNKYKDSIILNSKATSFLSKQYLQKYGQYLYGNFLDLFDKSFYEQHKNILSKCEDGLNPIQTRFFEIIRYYAIKYFTSSEINTDNDDISFILKEREFKINEINVLSELSMRIWYKNIIKLMIDLFYEYIDGINLTYIILFICLSVITILYYSVIWKTNEEKLNTLLKESYDLINLFPQEIKI